MERRQARTHTHTAFSLLAANKMKFLFAIIQNLFQLLCRFFHIPDANGRIGE